jgi:threonine/homoserine/homoserine lactone efflux protein
MYLLLIFLSAVILSYFMSIPVGPVGVLCVRRTLENGKWPGFIVGLGASFSDTFYASVIAFNITIISSFIEQYRIYIQVIGIFILFFVGIKSLFFDEFKKYNEKYIYKNVISDFLNSFIINITNPSIIISFGALLVAFHIDKLLTNATFSIMFTIGIFVGSILWWFTLSSISSYFQKKIRRDIVPLIHKFSGVLILVFAFFLFLFTFWEIFLKI